MLMLVKETDIGTWTKTLVLIPLLLPAVLLLLVYSLSSQTQHLLKL